VTAKGNFGRGSNPYSSKTSGIEQNELAILLVRSKGGWGLYSFDGFHDGRISKTLRITAVGRLNFGYIADPEPAYWKNHRVSTWGWEVDRWMYGESGGSAGVNSMMVSTHANPQAPLPVLVPPKILLSSIRGPTSHRLRAGCVPERSVKHKREVYALS